MFDYTITVKFGFDFSKDLLNIDLNLINGGDLAYLLQQSQKTGFELWIKKAIEKGKTYIVYSAGSTIAAKDVSFRLKNEDLSEYTIKNYNGFSLVDFSVNPHWGLLDYKDKYQNKDLVIYITT